MIYMNRPIAPITVRSEKISKKCSIMKTSEGYPYEIKKLNITQDMTIKNIIDEAQKVLPSFETLTGLYLVDKDSKYQDLLSMPPQNKAIDLYNQLGNKKELGLIIDTYQGNKPLMRPTTGLIIDDCQKQKSVLSELMVIDRLPYVVANMVITPETTLEDIKKVIDEKLSPYYKSAKELHVVAENGCGYTSLDQRIPFNGKVLDYFNFKLEKSRLGESVVILIDTQY